ncbi:hypothetical protein JQ633_12130 [Bradyrhizobium tropiciagri]|uniref:calcium-binding protein n=1 Tax=Bradyrhizobium tropiciagri TaxID=312253 RepID=UPI001BA8793C|nr:calcium-binding protein [Bradyrhizobium tropiciagri]MBR0871111.1 hypothetical protein [Bradyrhizobium tropiciagri]
MATYHHFEVMPDPGPFLWPLPWADLMTSSYSASSTSITITNTDGSFTVAHGSFSVVGNTVQSGTITSLDHRGFSGTIYEEITNTSVDAHQFLTTAPADRMSIVFAGSDDLTGYVLDDTLNGYGGADNMTGGLGNDDYYVDSTLDTVNELAHEGIDTITTGLASYQLGANVEGLTFTGGSQHTGFGNQLDNVMRASDGGDHFLGFGGNDTFYSGGGSDTFFGGTGNDTYNVDAGDAVHEDPNEGLDTIYTSQPVFFMPGDVENLVMTGLGGPIRSPGSGGAGAGNDLDNTIRTNGVTGKVLYGEGGNDLMISIDSNNQLVGDQGDDTLVARGDNTAMIGGDGDDLFAINWTGNHLITDFSAGAGVHDRIDLQAFRAGGLFAGKTHCTIFRTC